MPNRLAEETSPYLRQHQDNPVDWYPWGDEAFERARAEDKPVLLSIGYAACHWCHVMAHESFEDPETARLMNERFVNVKVDREERPDVDAIYMDAVQAMTGHGGWPMTMFLTPDGLPFYGGTYFPPVDRHNLPSFRRLLDAISDAWRNRRDEVEEQGRKLVDHISLGPALQPSDADVDESVLDDALGAMAASFDERHGGFGGAPKFPQAMNLDLLLRLAARGRDDAGAMARATLDAMASGGIFDQIGGGWHRYSVDRAWVVPHFEKMLYDNALLLRTYARSWLSTGAARHREVAEATAAWMLAEMRDAGGGFWSSLDADSEGVEGKFYVWSLDEVRDVAGADADALVTRFGLTRAGNFEGANIPVVAGETHDETALRRGVEALRARRATRVRPGTDSKVLAAWNGLAAAALAEAGVALGHSEWVDAARDAMDFVLSTMRVDGRLMRSYRDDDVLGPRVAHLGVCEDYAFVLEACLALYEATFETRWLDEARWAADEAIRLFADDDGGGFFSTGTDAERLVVRPKDLVDNAVPSANSVMALELQRLARLTGDDAYEDRALGVVRLLRDAARRSPLGFGHLLQAVDFAVGDAVEIVVVGDRTADDTRALLNTARDRYLPNKVIAYSERATDDEARRIPLLAGRAPSDGRATAYVCRRGVCNLPVHEPDALVAQLAAT
ncbi:MAG TPA: thioredoxin domain-containing protein [Actinomycetota bacterium]|nr:thioredoxin domain-containing protein [Actinomycetota bacterium]